MSKESSTDHSSHSHGPAIGSAGLKHKRPLLIAFSLTFSFMLAEIVGGLLSGSLALLSDAAHMGTDVLGLGMALAAIYLANKPSAGQRTYGTYRLEVLTAIINALLLFGVGLYIIFEAFRRFNDPPEVLGVPMLIVASMGLVINIISFRLLQQGSKESLNLKGASLEVLSDLLGSVGVILASIIVITTGWPYADPVVAALIGLLVFPRTFTLLKQAIRIIMEVAPKSVDVVAAQRELESISGVKEVHDLHIWTITSGIEAGSVHILIGKTADWNDVLDKSRTILEEKYGVTHPTIQIEPYGHKEVRGVI